ncbi:hypothetical protein [Frigoriglobus tundricola]|uniref:hypothetical protein n=1 Tax=Frigoriglobus tundricola TaxID=2774151 RepID=UPI00148EDAA1|nr:hypothetical protein [Frigoriglobus tundricola]
MIDRGECGSCVAKWVYACDVYGRCSPHGWHAGVKRCDGCVHRADRGSEQPDPDVRRAVLLYEGGTSDALVLSAAIESLHRAHPGRFVTAVAGPGAELFDHNPHVVTAEPVIDRAPVAWERLAVPGTPDECPLDALRDSCNALGAALGVPVPLAVDRPCVYLSPDERGRAPQVPEGTGGSPRSWLVDGGGGDEGPAGRWTAADLPRVAELVGDRVRIVPIGAAGTDQRELARAVWHAAGARAGGTPTAPVRRVREAVCVRRRGAGRRGVPD